MVQHIILWKLKEELNGKDKKEVLDGIKNNLESLSGKIPGLLDIKVINKSLSSSNADAMLNCKLEDETSLKLYQSHPEHVKVADTYVRPYTEIRMCIDYEI